MVRFVFAKYTMFSSTAFPRIPFTGSNEIVQPKETPDPDENGTPPAIPFDALLLVSEEAHEESNANAISRALEPWQKRIVDNYTAVAPDIDTKDAAEFLVSLCFIATRNQKQ